MAHLAQMFFLLNWAHRVGSPNRIVSGTPSYFWISMWHAVEALTRDSVDFGWKLAVIVLAVKVVMS